MAYIHHLDPFAIQFTENFGIRWYGLAYLSGFVIGYFAILLLLKRGRILLKEQEIADFVTYVAVGVLAGGRLGYCLFYAPDLFVSFDSHFPYWGVLKVNEGGMASHGGIFGVILMCWVYARRHRVPFLHCVDLTVFGGSLAFFFGRIANFVNGELFGRPTSETFALAVKFPQEILLWLQSEFYRLNSLAPVVEQVGQVTIGGEQVKVTTSIWQSWLNAYAYDVNAREGVHNMIDKILKQAQQGNEAILAALGPLLTPRHPSQLYQAVLEGLLVFLLLFWIWRKPRKAGVVGGWFGIGYSVARIVGEQFRLPDAHIGFQLLGLTRGQWLSLGFLAFSIAYLVYAQRQKSDELGGWMRKYTAALQKTTAKKR